MKVFPLVVLGIVATAGTALADQVQYRCDFPEGDGKRWIQPEYLVEYNSDLTEAQAMDPIIMATQGAPMAVSIRQLTTGKIELKWSINGMSDARNRRAPTFAYKLSFDPVSGAARIHAEPVGFDNSFHAQGRCTPA